MGIIFWILLTFMTGFCSLRLITSLDVKKTEDRPLDLFLAWGIGTGITAQVAFFSVLLFDRFSCVDLIALVLIIFSLLWFFSCKYALGNTIRWQGSPYIFLIFLPVILLLVYKQSLSPYGDWDAWSLWNFRANAIFRSGASQWGYIFHNDTQRSHPWLLPFFVAWGWACAGRETPLVPITVATAMTMATVGLLVYGLQQYVKPVVAYVAGFFLLSLPFFFYHSTSQYAEILVAFYFLAVILCVLKTLNSSGPKYMILAGMFLSFLAFSKDEGILLAAIALLVILVKPGLRKHLFQRPFWITAGVSVLALIICKILMRSDILPGSNMLHEEHKTNIMQLFQWTRWEMIFLYIYENTIWSAGWYSLIILILLAGFRSIFNKSTFTEKIIQALLAGYCAAILFLYIVVSGDIRWRMALTMNRVVFQVAPVIVLLVFLKIFSRDRPDHSSFKGV